MNKLGKKDKRVISGLILIPFVLSSRLYIPAIKSEKSKAQTLKISDDAQMDERNDGRQAEWTERCA